MPATTTAAAWRADQVGSLLRPASVKTAHVEYADGKLALADLRRIEDAAILEVLELQRQAGLHIFSDGEFRRASWSGDFQESLAEGYVAGRPSVTVFNTAQGDGEPWASTRTRRSRKTSRRTTSR